VIARRRPSATRGRNKCHFDRGAAAVEMALVMPLLIAMIIGIIDFSRIFNAELQLSQAAREGARLASLGFSLSDVQDRAVLAAPSPAFGAQLPKSGVTVSPACTATSLSTDVAGVQVTYQFQGIFWMNGSWLTQKAVMRCAG
jgi:Flp pilus assembly protein TadG